MDRRYLHVQNSSDDFFSGDPFKSSSTDSSKDPFRSSDFFSGTDLFDGPGEKNSEGSSKHPASNKNDPFGSGSTKSNSDPFTASFASFPDLSKQRNTKVFSDEFHECLLNLSQDSRHCSWRQPLVSQFLCFLHMTFQL